MQKETLTKIGTVLLSFLLFACSSTKVIDKNCKVISASKLKDRDLTPGKGSAVGAASGASIGALIGGFTGAVVGAGATIVTFGLAAPAIPTFAVAGAAAGGGIGAVSGAGGGYIYDYNKSGSGLYAYKVACINQEEPITVTQIDNKPFVSGSAVELSLDKDKYLIKEVSKKS